MICGAKGSLVGSCGGFPGGNRRFGRREGPVLVFAAFFSGGESHGYSVVARFDSVQLGRPGRPSPPAGDAPCRARGVSPGAARGACGGAGTARPAPRDVQGERRRSRGAGRTPPDRGAARGGCRRPSDRPQGLDQQAGGEGDRGPLSRGALRPAHHHRGGQPALRRSAEGAARHAPGVGGGRCAGWSPTGASSSTRRGARTRNRSMCGGRGEVRNRRSRYAWGGSIPASSARAR
jgi:hypothetical protein